MKNAIILHGTCSKNEYYDRTQQTHSNNHWLPWLSKQLITRDIHTVAVEVPHAYDEQAQDYEDWKRELERFDITEDTVLIGHSFGAGFLLRWMTENSQQKVNKLVLVAPWLDPERIHGSFFEFVIDSGLNERIDSVVIFNSLDDDQDVLDSTNQIRGVLSNLHYFEFKEKGHFTSKSLGSYEFPELLEVIVREKEKEFHGEPVTYIETMQVKEGVECDVYHFDQDQTKDLGIARVQSGCKTPLQKVLLGDRIIEGHVRGKSVLRVDQDEYVFPNPDVHAVTVHVGQTVQWEALEDLEFYEICHPPYTDGRFENIDDA